METDGVLGEFLLENKAQGENYTHVSMVHPMGRFRIKPDERDAFWKVYCDRLYNNPNFIAGLAEHPEKNVRTQYLPIFVDVDLKIPFDPAHRDSNQKLYTYEQVFQVIRIYQEQLKAILKSYQPENAICFLLEKQYPIVCSNGIISHGFHIHFPYTWLSQIDQDIHLIPRIKKQMETHNVFASLGIVNSASVIDKSSTHQQWLMYGSRKNNNTQSYLVTKIFNDECREITLSQALCSYRLYDSQEEEVKMEQDKLEYYLPQILSISSLGKKPICQVVDQLEIITTASLKSAHESSKLYEGVPVPEMLGMATKLLELIKPSRADEYENWMKIGWILYNIGDGCQEAYNLWVLFSKQTAKKNFSEGSCMFAWSKMEKKDMSIGSLRYYAKQDSPSEYKKLANKSLNDLYTEILNGGHNGLAKIMFKRCADEFVCPSVKDKIWFKYEKHRWSPDDHGTNLSKKITDDLVIVFRKYRQKIVNSMGKEISKEAIEEMEKREKSVKKLIANLQSAPFKANVMKECMEIFHDEHFLKDLDTNPNLLHFKNGILDVSKEQLKFRAGLPSDRVSMTTGYEFKEYFHGHPEVLEVEEILSQIFPDKELYNFFMEYAAELLHGGNVRKQVLIHTGVGNNGKSMVMDLLGKAFGDYMKSQTTSVLTGPRSQSSGATAEWEHMEGLRHVILNEPSKTDKLNLGVLKELSGNDKFYKRDLYKGGVNVDILFKLGMVCNDLPVIPYSDPAAWNRILVLPYESKFLTEKSEVPVTLKEQYEKKIFNADPYLKDKFERLRDKFMWLIFEKYKEVTLRGWWSPLPQKVLDAGKKYRRDSDAIYEYIQMNIIEDSKLDLKASISTAELCNSFSEWYKKSGNALNCMPKRKELIDNFMTRWKIEPFRNKWKGYRLRTAEDDSEDDGASHPLETKDDGTENKVEMKGDGTKDEKKEVVPEIAYKAPEDIEAWVSVECEEKIPRLLHR